MSTNTLALNRVTTTGWRMGFRNMLAKELKGWFGTRTWLAQALTWVGIGDFLLVVLLYLAPKSDFKSVAELRETALMLFTLFAGSATAMGAAVAVQGALVGEKQLGTAAWVLSKPLSRTAFIISKVIAYGFGFLVCGIAIPGAVAYALVAGSAVGAVPVVPFLQGLGVMWLHVMFYITLTIMLGAIFSSRGPVIGIPMMVLFLYQLFLGVVPKLYYVGPWQLTTNVTDPARPEMGTQSLANALIAGQPLPSLIPLASTIVLSIVFVVVALWRFEREEF